MPTCSCTYSCALASILTIFLNLLFTLSLVLVRRGKPMLLPARTDRQSIAVPATTAILCHLQHVREVAAAAPVRNGAYRLKMG